MSIGDESAFEVPASRLSETIQSWNGVVGVSDFGTKPGCEPGELGGLTELREAGELGGLTELPEMLAAIDVSHLEETALTSVLAKARAAQRCLDGLVLRIGARADELAAAGRSAPAPEVIRGGGEVGSRQAGKEAARSRTASRIEGAQAAASTGRISPEHLDSLARHTGELTDDQRQAVDLPRLIQQAEGLPPETFDRLLKQRVREIVGDHGLADTRAKQSASRFRHWFDHGTGMGNFSGSLDPERYEALTEVIDQHAASIAASSDTTVTRSSNLAARALVELVLDAAAPNGRRRLPSITIVVDHETVVRGPHPGSTCRTGSGHDLAPESVARLCCDAVVRKIELDTKGLPINVGRTHRTATDAQWAALKSIHTTCAWDGCPAPIAWCQAHHILEWERGGSTDLGNLVPLCSQHHHRVHEGRWSIRLLADRTLEIFKPNGTHHTSVDPPMRC